MDNKQARYLHRMLDRLAEGKSLSPEEIKLLRESLPELPKQKTLTELRHEVNDAWVGADGNEWPDDAHGVLETWLLELHEQLQGLQDTPAAPALPSGMRIAEHENFGRVVVSPGVGVDKCYEVFYLDLGMASGADISEVEPDSLTFIDSEPAHPEFLETEADYAAAPEGTIVASSGRFPWVKGAAGEWACSSSNNSDFAMSKIGRRNVIRWGWGNE